MAGVGKKCIQSNTTMTPPNITKKQQEILKYLYHFRFLNRVQIQALLNHKDYRLINAWLKDLTEKQCLNRIYSNKYGENTKPAIYYIGPNGIKFIKEITNCPRKIIQRLSQEKDRSEHFIGICQQVADIYINTRKQANDKTSYKAIANNAFAIPNSNYNFLADSTIDLVIEETKESMKKYYALEVFDSTLRGYMIKKRIKNYFDLYFSNSWEENISGAFPTILIATETLSMMISAKQIARKLLREYDELENFDMKFSVLKDVSGEGIISDIWETIEKI